jgi:hypothetical protein
MKKLLFGMLLAPMAFGTNIALADGWPTSVVGNWDIVGNHSPGTLSITSQGGAGDCRPIGGTIYNDSIQGFYCPHSGRIHFIRSNGGGAFEVFSGNLSQAQTPLYMTGTVAVDRYSGFGEYNFQGSPHVQIQIR